VNEEQRLDLVRNAEDECRQVAREYGWGSAQATEAHQWQLNVERSTAGELGLAYAERMDLGVQWDTGAPMPVLISGGRTFVAFFLSVHDPLFDGANPRIRDQRADRGIGIVEFTGAMSVTMGSPNDEVLDGHGGA